MAGERSFFADASSLSFASKISRPIAQQSSASISAGILISLSWCQVAKGSSKDSMTYVKSPRAGIRIQVLKRSLPWPCSRIRVRDSSRPLRSKRRTSAPSASWPSRKIVALTSISSPAIALTGTNSPPKKTDGLISVMGMRLIMKVLADESARAFGVAWICSRDVIEAVLIERLLYN